MGTSLGSKPTNNQKARELIGTFPIGQPPGAQSRVQRDGERTWKNKQEKLSTQSNVSEGESWEMRPDK